ncbi:MAG TPA: hypothetical protein VG406_01680 [Isosphaeraceae bacterium]|jgi:hypothetical protein|nr:hypothetical protein [Isosphaeraceae bacterium]
MLRFSIADVLILIVCVAAFLGLVSHIIQSQHQEERAHIAKLDGRRLAAYRAAVRQMASHNRTIEVGFLIIGLLGGLAAYFQIKSGLLLLREAGRFRSLLSRLRASNPQTPENPSVQEDGVLHTHYEGVDRPRDRPP